MARRHYRVTLRDVLDAHDLALSTSGGAPGILRIEGVESAVARPYSGYHRRIWSKAAALAESLARNHGFTDGNKRTTLIVVHLFVLRSGYSLAVSVAEAREFEDLIVQIADGKLAFAEIEDWFRRKIRKRAVRN